MASDQSIQKLSVVYGSCLKVTVSQRLCAFSAAMSLSVFRYDLQKTKRAENWMQIFDTEIHNLHCIYMKIWKV